MRFQCRYNSEICAYQDSSAIFFSFLVLCRKERKKKSLLLPQTADSLPCLCPLIFSSIVVTAVSLIYVSSIQLQPVWYSVGIQTQFLTLHRNYFWNFKNTPSVTWCSYASCLPWRMTWRRKAKLQPPQQSWYNAAFVFGPYSCMTAA